MEHLAFATIEALESALEKKELTREEILTYYLRRFETFDPTIKSALEIFDKESILKASKEKGPLSGIPGIIKDNLCQKDRITSCASRMLEHFTSPYDATVCKRLKDAGALLVGRANLDEFAMGSSTENSAFQKTKNPWDTSRVPGGSSGGSAAAVAAGFVPWALGSDTGGSVRQPAAFCGIVGLKPTYGLISRYGLVAYGSSFDTVGIFTRTVKDNAKILSVIAGQDSKDSTSLPVEKKQYEADIDNKPTVTIGVVDNALEAMGMDEEIKAAIEEALKILEKQGAKIKRIKMPSLDYSAAAYFILSRAEAASNLARFDGVRYGMRDKNEKTLNAMYDQTRHDGFGAEVKSRILVGNYVLSAGHAGEFYENAQKVRHMIRDEYKAAFKDVDIVVLPTHPAPAFTFGKFDVDKLQMDLQDYFTCSINLAGIPAISIPCGFTSSNMPIGFQLVGPHLSEELLYKVAHAYEKETNWHTKHPAL